MNLSGKRMPCCSRRRTTVRRYHAVMKRRPEEFKLLDARLADLMHYQSSVQGKDSSNPSNPPEQTVTSSVKAVSCGLTSENLLQSSLSVTGPSTVHLRPSDSPHMTCESWPSAVQLTMEPPQQICVQLGGGAAYPQRFITWLLRKLAG